MKKAMAVVSFGTTHADAADACIRPVERAIAAAFPDWTVCRAYTSRIICRRLKAQGIAVENEAEALARLRAEGNDRLAAVSTNIIPGGEYDRLIAAAGSIPVSEPLLYSDDDLRWMAALLDGFASEQDGALLAMGHGTEHRADALYSRLRAMLSPRVKLACVEGALSLDGIVEALDALPHRSLTLMPLMLVAGEHAAKDLAGDGDSWKNRLAARGFDIRLRLAGLGALPEVQARFVEKARRAIEPM